MTRLQSVVDGVCRLVIALLVVVVGTTMLVACSSPAFDVAALDVEDAGDDGVSETAAADTHPSEERKDTGHVEAEPDTGAGVDSAPPSDTSPPPPTDTAGATDSGAPPDTTDVGAEVHCSRYCWKSFGTTPVGAHCETSADCCSTNCDSVGVGATHTCMPPTDPASGTWCGGTEEWCPTFASSECVP